jgi:hypothetical protein
MNEPVLDAVELDDFVLLVVIFVVPFNRYDRSRGTAGGFFDDGVLRPGVAGLTSAQHLLTVGVIATFDSSLRQ